VVVVALRLLLPQGPQVSGHEELHPSKHRPSSSLRHATSRSSELTSTSKDKGTDIVEMSLAMISTCSHYCSPYMLVYIRLRSLFISVYPLNLPITTHRSHRPAPNIKVTTTKNLNGIYTHPRTSSLLPKQSRLHSRLFHRRLEQNPHLQPSLATTRQIPQWPNNVSRRAPRSRIDLLYFPTSLFQSHSQGSEGQRVDFGLDRQHVLRGWYQCDSLPGHALV
jgi:hypothetical protein